MNEELKGRLGEILDAWQARPFVQVAPEQLEDLQRIILTIVVAERDSMKEAAAKVTDAWIGTNCNQPHEDNPCCHTRVAVEIGSRIRFLTPSTAQSREREIRLDEARRIRAKYHSIEEKERWITFVRFMDIEVAELESASSQPKVEHDYKSTACFHKQHDRCRQECKFCAVKCSCACHSRPKGDQ